MDGSNIPWDLMGPVGFIGAIIWDLGRRFAPRPSQVDKTDFLEVAEEVDRHAIAVDELADLKARLAELEGVREQVAKHETALGTHADSLVVHGERLEKHGRTLTALGLGSASALPDASARRPGARR
jgi:hypothetical protein